MRINSYFNKRINLEFIIILFILSYNLYVRFITLKIFNEYEKLSILFIYIMIIIWSIYKKYIKTGVSFIFGFSFFLYGFRPYDIQSQIFETVVLMVSYYYLIDNFLNNNSKTLNNTLKNIFIIFIILSFGSVLVLPIKYILYNFMNLGNEWYLYQIVNATPKSFYYSLNGVNKLILYFTFSVIMSCSSTKTFKFLFLGLFWGGLFCSIIGLLDFYNIISLKWYSNTVTQNVLSSTFMIPLFVQEIQHYTPLRAGMLMIPGGLSLLILFPLSGRLTDMLPTSYLIYFGLFSFGMAFVLMSQADVNTPFWTFVSFTILIRVGTAFIRPVMNTEALRALPNDLVDQGSGVVNFIRMLGAAIGTNVLVVFLELRIPFHLDAFTATQVSISRASGELVEQITRLLSEAGVAEAIRNTGAIHYLGDVILAQASTQGFQDAFLALGIFAFCGFIPAVYLSQAQRKK